MSFPKDAPMREASVRKGKEDRVFMLERIQCKATRDGRLHIVVYRRCEVRLEPGSTSTLLTMTAVEPSDWVGWVIPAWTFSSYAQPRGAEMLQNGMTSIVAMKAHHWLDSKLAHPLGLWKARKGEDLLGSCTKMKSLSTSIVYTAWPSSGMLPDLGCTMDVMHF